MDKNKERRACLGRDTVSGGFSLRSMVCSALIAGVGFCLAQPAAAAGKHSAGGFVTAGTRVEALDSALWERSEWISVKDMPVVAGRIDDGSRAADGASWFSTSIRNGKKIKSAKWMTSGLGVFDLFVNGKRIGEEVLKPGFTHHSKTRLSFTYDITDALLKKKGSDNVLTVQVTPGWWADKIITPAGREGFIGGKPAFRGVVELTYADGSKSLHGTDTTDWHGAVGGPVTHAAIFDGEEYDARIPQPLAAADINGATEVNSFNHYAYGCVCEWMWETMAGISADPSDPGFRRIVMKPVPDRRLGHVEAEYDSAAGRISSAWRYEGDDWVWDFTVPEGSVAAVTLPGENTVKEYGSGSHTVRKPMPAGR